MMNLSYGIVIHLVHAEISVKITTTYVGVLCRERDQEHAGYHATMSSFGYQDYADNPCSPSCVSGVDFEIHHVLLIMSTQIRS